MRTLFVCAMAMALTGTAFGQNYRQELRDRVGSSQNQSYRETYPDQDRQRSDYYSESSSSQQQVRHFNKASNLIGADVRTRDAQKVGEVKDVVIDFDSGRVAYVVVDANDVVDGDATHIALPAQAFRVTRDQNHVTIEVDRNRLRNARTFEDENLPAFRSQGRSSMQSSQQQWRQQQQSRDQSGFSGDSSSWSQDRYGQNRNQQQSSRSQSSEDPNLYLYEWYVYDVEPSGQYQSRGYSSQPRRSSQPYGGYGSTQYGTEEYYTDRELYQDRAGRSGSQYQQQGRYQTDRYGNQQWSDDQDEWQSSQNQNYWRQQQDRSGNQSQYGQGRSGQSQYGQQYGRQSRDRDYSDYSYEYDQDTTSDWNQQDPYGRQQNQSSRQSSRSAYDTDYRDQGSGSQSTRGQGTSGTSQSSRSNQQSSNWSSSDDGQPSQPTSSQNSRNFTGRIREIDQQNRTLTVEGSNRTMTFKLTENPIVKKSGQENTSFSQLKEGERVQIGYRYQDGSNRAFSINQTPGQQRTSSQDSSSQDSQGSSDNE